MDSRWILVLFCIGSIGLGLGGAELARRHGLAARTQAPIKLSID
jgi:hypothetical protein